MHLVGPVVEAKFGIVALVVVGDGQATPTTFKLFVVGPLGVAPCIVGGADQASVGKPDLDVLERVEPLALQPARRNRWGAIHDASRSCQELVGGDRPVAEHLQRTQPGLRCASRHR